MPGASDLKENKIFRDIALGTAGKDGRNRISDHRKYWDAPLWKNLEKKKKKKDPQRK